LGSGENGEFTFLDTLNILSFCIGMMNLNENLTQGDKQDLQKQLSEKTELLLKEIHSHLEEQDRKLDKIMEVVNKDDY
jgi:hypothetical protein